MFIHHPRGLRPLITPLIEFLNRIEFMDTIIFHAEVHLFLDPSRLCPIFMNPKQRHNNAFSSLASQTSATTDHYRCYYPDMMKWGCVRSWCGFDTHTNDGLSLMIFPQLFFFLSGVSNISVSQLICELCEYGGRLNRPVQCLVFALNQKQYRQHG